MAESNRVHGSPGRGVLLLRGPLGRQPGRPAPRARARSAFGGKAVSTEACPPCSRARAAAANASTASASGSVAAAPR